MSSYAAKAIDTLQAELAEAVNERDALRKALGKLITELEKAVPQPSLVLMAPAIGNAVAALAMKADRSRRR